MPSEEEKTIAKFLLETIGGPSKMLKYRHGEEDYSVDMFSAVDRPVEGVTSYSTVGLSNWPLMKEGAELPARIELIGACASAVPFFPSALATAAFFIMRDGWICGPGVIFQGILPLYESGAGLPHLFFVPPVSWDKEMRVEFPGKLVLWLQAVPISDPERAYAETQGPEALVELFGEREIRLFDINRPSVL